MNLTANPFSLTMAEGQKPSWDWSALNSETPTERATSSGRKRNIEGFANDGSDRSTKKFKHESTPTGAPSNRPQLLTRHAMKSPKLSSTRLGDRSSLNLSQSTANAVRPKPPAAPLMKSQGPFYIDSDSDSDDADNEASSPIPARHDETPRQQPIGRFASGLSSDWKEAQRLESHRKREEAKRRNDVSFTSSSTLGRDEGVKPSTLTHDHDEMARRAKHSVIVGIAGARDGPSKETSPPRHGKHEIPPTSFPFKRTIKSELRDSPASTRRTPATQTPAMSAVIDLTDDDPINPPQPPRRPDSNVHQARHGLDFQARQDVLLEQRVAQAKAQAETERRADQERKSEEEKEKKAAEERQKEHDQKRLQADNLARLQQGKHADLTTH